MKVLEKLKDLDWDCFFRGNYYGCYYYMNSGDSKSKEFIGNTLEEVLNQMWDCFNTDHRAVNKEK